MTAQSQFNKFNDEIRLSKSKREELKRNRKALRKAIRDYFKAKGWTMPQFASQGSFPLLTNLNPIQKGSYDIDDGVYFICPEDECESVEVYHRRIKEAVKDHAKKTKDKDACVRVLYANDHHVDLPIYWMPDQDSIPLLAHKRDGYIESDPKAFKEWVDEEMQGDGQLRRLIRYLKAWKDQRESSNSSIKLPSGFILTILACEEYDAADSDDIAFRDTVAAISERLRNDFTCYNPAVEDWENLLDRYRCDVVTDEFDKMSDQAEEACEGSGDGWSDIFGDRFPKSGGRGGGNSGPDRSPKNGGQSDGTRAAAVTMAGEGRMIPVHKPWFPV